MKLGPRSARIAGWQEHIAVDATDRSRVPEREGIGGVVHPLEQRDGNVTATCCFVIGLHFPLVRTYCIFDLGE